MPLLHWHVDSLPLSHQWSSKSRPISLFYSRKMPSITVSCVFLEVRSRCYGYIGRKDHERRAGTFHTESNMWIGLWRKYWVFSNGEISSCVTWIGIGIGIGKRLWLWGFQVPPTHSCKGHLIPCLLQLSTCPEAPHRAPCVSVSPLTVILAVGKALHEYLLIGFF